MRLFMVLAAATALPLTSVAAVPKSVQSPVLRIDKSRIDRALQSMVTDGRAAGASALVWRDGKEVYFGTAGFADSEAKRPFRRDTLVQIWSMTKPVTGVALMQLWEQGKFRLDDPLSDYLSEFGQTKVFAGTDAAGNPILRPPHRPILVRDIMRHTAGFGEGAAGSYPQKMFDAADPLNFDNDLTEFGQIIEKRVVQPELSLLPQLHQRDAGDRLGHRPDLGERVAAHWPLRLAVGVTGGPEIDFLAVPPHECRRACGAAA